MLFVSIHNKQKNQTMKLLITIATLFFAVQSMGQSSRETDILALSNLKFRYMTTQKLDSLANIFDDKMILQHANGMVQTKVEYLDNLTSGMLKYDSAITKDVSVRVVGETAILLGKCHFAIHFNGNPAAYDFAYTEVYAMTNKKWKLLLYAVQNPAGNH